MTDPPHWKKENNWSRLQMGGSLCYTMGVILVKTSTGWPLFPWEISPYKTVTQTCGPIRGRRTLAAARPPRTYKHRLQRSICWYPHWTNEQHRLFKRRGACGKTNILKTWISMPFFFLSYIWFKIYKADSWCGALQTRHWGLPQEMVHCSTGSRQVGQDQSEPEVADVTGKGGGG